MKQSAAAKLLGGAFATMLCQNQFINQMIIQNQKKINEAHAGHGGGEGGEPSEFEMQHAKDDYQALKDMDAIFEGKSAGMMDQHEMMELMMKSQKDRLRPYPFEKISNNIGGFKQFDVVDGLKVNIMLPMGQLFQLGGEWKLSNSKGPAFEFTSVVCHQDGEPNPMQMQAPDRTAHFAFGSDQTGRVQGSFNLPFGIQCQTQTMFNDPACKDIMNMVQMQKDFRDCAVSLRYQGMHGHGAYTSSFMQSLNRSIQAGFQVHYQPQSSLISYGYCAFYKLGGLQGGPEHQFAFGYNPLQQKDTHNFSYIGKPSHRMQLFSELKGNFFSRQASSEFLAGGRLRFDQGMITGYARSNGQLHGTYMKSLDFGKIEFNSQIDVLGKSNRCLFGLDLQIGMGM